MANFPNWKDLSKKAKDLRESKLTPQKQEEMRERAQRGIDVGRDQLSKRLKGPAEHLRNVGSSFKDGLGNTDAPPAPAADGPADPPPTEKPLAEN